MSGAGWVVAVADAHKQIRRDLDETVAAAPPDIAVEGVVLEGRPWRELAEHSSGLDMLFVGSRGYGPLQAVMLGRTSGPLMREAHCPVIALPRTVTSMRLFDDEAVATA
jgi:nucleotide-binding universal stress UspA family protein